ncbi:MAG: hypothetical protein E7293_11430 [Lachnospiraceae bacterium]|nr:hypothetical protein [Lachnospiraceae bacterium]
MIRMKKILSLVLAFVLFASVCTNGSMTVFAVGSETTLTAVPAGVAPTEESFGTQVAYVANDTVTVYEYYENGALGMVCTGALGEQIELTKKFTYTVDGVDTVIYHFADSDFAGAMGAADDANYQFILASDVTFTAPEVTLEPEPTETAIPDSATGVSVAGDLPDDVTLTVTEKTLAESGIDTTVYPISGASLFYDVTLLQNSAEYQPENSITVTFPETAITNSGLEIGDSYKVYHIHDGVTDVTGPFKYTGGAIDATFYSLSVVGFAETSDAIDLVTQHGEATVTHLDENIVLTINSDSVTLYDGYESNVYTAEVTGTAGIEVEAYMKVSFADAFVVYQYAYYGDDADFKTAARTYQFISADDVTDGTEKQQSCVICGKVNCTVVHLYCDICNKFDCGQTHTYENPYKPDMTPVIPASPELTEGADVSIVDAKGNAITEIGIQLYEGEKTSFSAWSNLEDVGNVSYQWQICYDTENDLWADVKGQNGKGLLISPAMVNSVIQLTGSAMIRCQITSGASVQYSAGIPVEVVQDIFASKARYSLARTAGNAALYADTPELSEYTIVINYVFEDGTTVAQPYTATLAAGSSFSATVTHPNVMGYLPYVGNDAETSTQIDLNIANIQADVTYTVTYKPTNVNYTVIHYQQNVDNDNYTIVETETKTGLTKSTVPDVAKNYTGFYELLYERPAIAADGSTVVEIYYDRNYYLVNFDMDGGYGTEPIYARYGAPVEAEDPTRAGYTFLGWSEDGETVIDLPTTVPAENKIYIAVWEVDATAKVTIVFWGENADDEEYSYLGSDTIYLEPGTDYEYPNSSISCPMPEHSHNDCEKNCTHTHTVDCYYSYYGLTEVSASSLPTQITSQNTINDGIYTYSTTGYRGTTYYYLKLAGKWYTGVNWRDVSDPEREIREECNHVCGDACHTCGKIAHTHSSDCSGLWTFISSDKVTVKADGSTVVDVYYDRTERTLTFKYDYRSDSYQATETITAKWGASIDTQYKAIADNAGSTFWSASLEGGGPYTNHFEIMPQASKNYYNIGASGSEGSMSYYGENVAGDGYDLMFSVPNVGGYNVTEEDRYEFEGFTYHHGAENGDDCEGAEFYYTRNSYTLTFNDGYSDVKSESVKYEAPLSTYADYVPEVPSAYEPGSVEFGGWYQNPECSGGEVILNALTMPAENVLLYAKWIPVTHTVSFYLDLAAWNAGTTLTTHPDVTVPHGEKMENVPIVPENGSYTFVGWFYQDNGVEKAFDFANMSVTKDMQVYGKWSSNVLKEYSVYFKIQDTETEIAAPITGSGLAGTTKTFDAKGGTDLYDDYQEGYFPLVKSHSMTLDIDNDVSNTYTFWYVQKDAVPYTVYYVTENQNEAGSLQSIELNGKTYYIVEDTYTNSDNRQAVVTEKFKPVSGYMPDAYQKRLVVDGTDGAENKIVFIYSEDTTHAYYKITHYTQNLDDETWTEYASSQAVGEIGHTYTADPLTIDGFTYDSSVDVTVVSGELTANGLELKLYYVRNDYPYEVRYLEQGTGKQLADPKAETGKYGQVISERAIDIAGYTAVAPTDATMTIRIEEKSTTEAKLNIINFYYVEKEAMINYVVVGPDDCGTVSLDSETVKVLTGTATGSTATANKNYKFVGWYGNVACTGDAVSTDASYVPTKPNNGWADVTYYAKFELAVADLIITKNGCEDTDEKQSFIFDVTGPNGFKMTVTINGNGSVTIKDLPIGKYTVTERTDWSWRYTPGDTTQTITLAADGSNTVAFINSRSCIYWLSGDSYKENQFTVKPKNQGN